MNINYILIPFGIYIGCLLGPVIGLQIALSDFEKRQYIITPESVEQRALLDQRISRSIDKRFNHIMEDKWISKN